MITNPASEYSWSFLNQLHESVGGSFYVLDLKRFASNYAEFLNAFRGIYPKSNIAYSYKTNYTPVLCKHVLQVGGYAEVVSYMEYQLALRIGVPPTRIIFNGPLKTKTDLEHALLNNSIVNLDSWAEVHAVTDLAIRQPDKMFRIGIRCNFDVGTGTISRFGFDTENGALEKICETLKPINNCRLVGLHCHIGTAARSYESYALRTEKLLEAHRRHFAGQSLEFLDIGGGYFGKLPEVLRDQYSVPVPSYADYAKAIAGRMAAAFRGDHGPELILEPGVGITGDCMEFICQIVDLKEVRSQQFASVNGSIFDIKPMRSEKNLPMTVVHSPQPDSVLRKSRLMDIVGHTCMEIDCLYRAYTGKLAIGDYLIFSNVGAYTNVLRPPFIQPSPPIFLRDHSTGEFRLVKQRGTFDNIFAMYVLP